MVCFSQASVACHDACVQVKGVSADEKRKRMMDFFYETVRSPGMRHFH